jgi:hypothetical protein
MENGTKELLQHAAIGMAMGIIAAYLVNRQLYKKTAQYAGFVDSGQDYDTAGGPDEGGVRGGGRGDGPPQSHGSGGGGNVPNQQTGIGGTIMQQAGGAFQKLRKFLTRGRNHWNGQQQ